MRVEQIQDSDLSTVAEIHVLAFPKSAITRMGVEAANRYYSWQLNGPHECHAVGAFFNGEMLGYCFGGVFDGALSGFLSRNRLFLVRRVLVRPWLITDELFRSRIRDGLSALVRRNNSSNIQEQKRQRERSFGILSLAVNPVRQSSGVGRALMADAEEEARRRGFGRMHLTVDPSNNRALRFYERQGWQRLAAEGRPWTGRMIKEL